MAPRSFALLAVLSAFCFPLATAVSGQELLKPLEKASYTLGQAIPVSCLNRTIDTGEHITDAHGDLVYSPFPVCNETGRPLELSFGIEKEMNCTIDFISDPLFHLLEFYIHNDAPLTCRIPSRPLPSTADPAPLARARPLDDDTDKVGALGAQSTAYVPLVVALTGTLQRSHLHVANHLNVLLHAAPRAVAPGMVDAATAYSVSHATQHARIVIGDSLTLQLSVRWYPTTSLPSGWTGVGGHLYLSTLVYCALSAGAATAVCVVYFRAVELPQRLRQHGRQRTWGGGPPSPGTGRFNGYAYGGGGGYALGKRD